MKKLIAIMLSIMTTLMFTAVPGFADTTGSITAKNIETGATVTAYQIVQKSADGGWDAVKSGSIADPKAPTADEITALAKELAGSGGIALTESSESSMDGEVAVTSYSKTELDPGMYLVLVNKTPNAFVYNPMIVSVNYDDLDGIVDANSNFSIGESTAYAKRSKPGLEKEIVDSSQNKKGDTMAIGDTAKFQISTQIPAYSSEYDNDKLKFEIKDQVSQGLDAPTDIIVKEGNSTLTAGTDYELIQEEKGFTVKFKKSYLLSDAAKSITITYNAKLNEEATSGFDANTNTAKLTFSNSPDSTSDMDKKTYHYTFDIDGDVFGSMTGREIVKVGRDEKSGELITKETSAEETASIALEGAVFELYKEDKETQVASTTSTKDGLLQFSGLDAGSYYLKETQAPSGYKTDSTWIPVVITATLNDDGTLASYTVTINGQNTTTYTWNNEGNSPSVDKTGDTSLFNNYKAGLLPSTGGSGIYFYIALGTLLIAVAAALFIRGRRREHE